jgi:hypothetical protein
LRGKDLNLRPLGYEPKDVFDESDLLSDVALCQPANLSFADHVRRFIALDGPFPAGERAEAKARLDAPFDSTVILLDDISTTTQQEGSRRALYQCSQGLARHEILHHSRNIFRFPQYRCTGESEQAPGIGDSPSQGRHSNEGNGYSAAELGAFRRAGEEVLVVLRSYENDLLKLGDKRLDVIREYTNWDNLNDATARDLGKRP